eukprot:1384817-Pyramimonas_sp.AAC.1
MGPKRRSSVIWFSKDLWVLASSASRRSKTAQEAPGIAPRRHQRPPSARPDGPERRAPDGLNPE